MPPTDTGEGCANGSREHLLLWIVAYMSTTRAGCFSLLSRGRPHRITRNMISPNYDQRFRERDHGSDESSRIESG